MNDTFTFGLGSVFTNNCRSTTFFVEFRAFLYKDLWEEREATANFLASSPHISRQTLSFEKRKHHSLQTEVQAVKSEGFRKLAVVDMMSLPRVCSDITLRMEGVFGDMGSVLFVFLPPLPPPLRSPVFLFITRLRRWFFGHVLSS